MFFFGDCHSKGDDVLQGSKDCASLRIQKGTSDGEPEILVFDVLTCPDTLYRKPQAYPFHEPRSELLTRSFIAL